MKNFRMIICLVLVCVSSSVYANWFRDIWESELRMEIMQGYMLNNQGQLLSVERDIDSLMKNLNGHMTGHSGWGTYQVHDYQSYGKSAYNWFQVMQMAERGQGDGELGHTIGDISRQFPLDTSLYNRGVRDVRSQKYYAIKTQTILAARAASQLDYNKIQEQIAYQQMLQQQIEKTKDLKAAIDLSNRIQIEGNLISLEILRQAALTNQQQAVSEQASVNTALTNARFLIKE